MKNFFDNLGGGDKKKSGAGGNNKGKDSKDAPGWQGGRSGDMATLKKKNSSGVGASASRLVDGARDGVNKAKASGGNNNNVFANAGKGINEALGKMDLFKQNKPANNRGGGQSLGGSKPGKVISVSLDKPGTLGMEVEKRKNSQSTAIIAGIVPGGQADRAGLKRGDIVCHSGSNGEHEIKYDQFLAQAKSGRRPLRFDVRRIESSILGEGGGRSGTGSKASADAYARKQAVIAAAEAREAKHKATQKPIPKTEKRMDGLRPAQQIYEHGEGGDTEETRRAVAAAKKAEQDDAKNLGYNPYETARSTGGQARTATVAMTQGEINAENAPAKIAGSGEGRGGGMASPGKVNKPKDPTSKKTINNKPPSPEFEHAFSILVTSNADNAAVIKSLGIMRKLINNAITKGQQGNDETSSKFRRVRLSNPKIKEAIGDVQGGLELMMSVGFVLSENDEDGETYLVFPPGEKGADWLGSALDIMESYENGGS